MVAIGGSGPISNKNFSGNGSGATNVNSFLSKTSLFAKSKSGNTGVSTMVPYGTEGEEFGANTSEKNFSCPIVLLRTCLFSFRLSG